MTECLSSTGTEMLKLKHVDHRSWAAKLARCHLWPCAKFFAAAKVIAAKKPRCDPMRQMDPKNGRAGWDSVTDLLGDNGKL